VLRDPKAVASIRAARQQQQALANAAATAKDLAAAGNQGTQALSGMKQAGFL
jgi:hypothetical protein